MGRKEDILESVRRIAGPLAAQEGLELIEVEIGGAGGRQTLRLFIDKAGGVSLAAQGAPGGGASGGASVTLENCSSLSHAVSAALDVEDPIAGAYDLEVSSPGLDRPLRTPEHFEKFKGSKVRVKTFGPVAECENRKTFVGQLLGFAEDKVLVDVDGKVFHVPHAQVSKASVVPQVPGFDI